MRINAILPTFNSTLKYQKTSCLMDDKNQHVSNNHGEYIFAPSFQGSKVIMLSPNIKNCENKELYAKILDLLKKFPSGADTKNSVFLRKIGNDSIGIKLNTNNPELTIVEIKNMIEKSEDWDVSKNGQSSAILRLRPDGMMIEGEYSTKNLNNSYIDTIAFDRFSKRGRHLYVLGRTFSPSKACPGIWNYKADKNGSDLTYDISSEIKKSPFSEIFTELTKSNVVLK